MIMVFLGLKGMNGFGDGGFFRAVVSDGYLRGLYPVEACGSS